MSAYHGEAPRSLRRPSLIVVVGVGLIGWLAPLLLVLLASFGVLGSTTRGPSWRMDAFREVFAGGPALVYGIWPFILNSLAVTLPVVVLTLVLGTMAAYPMAWMPFPGARAWLVGVLVLALLPVQVAMLPLATVLDEGLTIGSVRVLAAMGLGHSYLPLWLAHVVFALPLTILLLRAAMSRIPRDLMDQARLDGAGDAVILSRLVVPLLLPALAAVGLLLFIWVWNDLLISLVFSGGSSAVMPVTAHLVDLKVAVGSRVPLVSAAALVSMAVPLILYAIARSTFHEGVRAVAALDR